MQTSEPLFHVVLVEPEIPNNTGNIGRLCVGTRSRLHLVGPLGFEINDRQLKRAGLDYWPHLSWCAYENYAQWTAQGPAREKTYYFSTKGKRDFFDVSFKPGDYFIFGKETKGLSEDILHGNEDRCLRLPMLGPIRSQNIANTVSIVVYEALRQNRAEWS